MLIFCFLELLICFVAIAPDPIKIKRKTAGIPNNIINRKYLGPDRVSSEIQNQIRIAKSIFTKKYSKIMVKKLISLTSGQLNF